MSEPSRKMSVTWESPNLVSDRISSTPWMPESSISSGMVTAFSVSSGARAGTSVLTCTCGLVMSGTASIGSVAADQRPIPSETAATSSRKARWRSEASMSR